MSWRTIGSWIALGAVVAGGAVGVWAWREHEAAEAREAARRAQEARAEREEEHRERVQRESSALMPDLLEGIYLGMPLDEVRRARPGLAPELDNVNPEPQTLVFDERFPNGARAVYVFERASERLQRVQVLSLLPSAEAVVPHLAAMNARYGQPNGIWDCPQTGGVPTRRFTWRQGEVTVSDVFLIVGNRVSVTLYIAPTPIIARSLRMAACRPVRSPDQLEAFPTAAPERPEAPPPP